MPPDSRLPDIRYHQIRIDQERRLAQSARSREARNCHAELMRLHEMKRDALPSAG